MRTSRSFPISKPSHYKEALLAWSRQHDPMLWLDSNGHTDAYSSFDALLAIAEQPSPVEAVSSTKALQQALSHKRDWWVGYFSYDLKNELEDLSSNNFDGLGFPDLYFFRPTKLIVLQGNQLRFLYQEAYAGDIVRDFSRLSAWTGAEDRVRVHSPIQLHRRLSKAAYLAKVEQLLRHIHRGDLYEANFCQEFYAKNATIAPWETYRRLNALSQPPFAAFLRLQDKYLLCASPERYLKKLGNTLVAQPMKGTAPRGTTPQEDQYYKAQLANNPKERAENIMITDLVRNDLSKSALRGSVVVPECCKVYSYPQVHQMISTVVAQVAPDKFPLALIEETFPMGSMTGAPKIAAMQHIEALEVTKRGLYSGAVGYFDPEGNFDFNVVIRSMLYNATRQYLSFSVGSAITAQSQPEQEYQECLLKAKALRQVLEG